MDPWGLFCVILEATSCVLQPKEIILVEWSARVLLMSRMGTPAKTPTRNAQLCLVAVLLLSLACSATAQVGELGACY